MEKKEGTTKVFIEAKGNPAGLQKIRGVVEKQFRGAKLHVDTPGLIVVMFEGSKKDMDAQYAQAKVVVRTGGLLLRLAGIRLRAWKE